MERREWHLEKTVSVGHIISTLVVASSLFGWAMSIDKRVEQNSQGIGFLGENYQRLENRVDTNRNELRQDLKEIHKKLDRLIESRSD